MAGAMLHRWLETGLDPASVTVIRPSGASVATGVRVLNTIPDEPAPALLLLGVKPQKIDDVGPALAATITSETLLISILAGVEAASLYQRFPNAGGIIRAMPNTPVALGKGATGLFATTATPAQRKTAEALMHPLGAVEWIADETLFDVLAALTASGPAFVFRFIDAFSAAAASLGLPADQAQRLAIATVEGAGALASASTETPHDLADRVASPSGMTRAGLDILDTDEALPRLVHATLAAAVRRSREMGAAARRS